MDIRSPEALLSALDGLEEFCRKVKATSTDESTLDAANEQFQTLSHLKAAVDHFFVDEGRIAALDRAPEAEIFRRPLGAADEYSPAPIFIIGNRRSGTTLIAYLLNVSEHVSSTPEAFLAGALASCDDLWRAAHRTKEVMDTPFPSFMRRIGQLVDATYLDHARATSKSRWASKELFAAHRLDLLDAMFDYRAQFVYAIRHGFDVAWSCATRFPMSDGLPLNGRTSLDVETYLDEWIANNESTMNFFERNRDRCFLFRYEEFVERPLEVGRELFGFVGEPWHEGLLEAAGSQALRGMGDNKIIKTGGKNHSV